MGMTAPHINWYIVVKEKNECHDVTIYPFRRKCTGRSMSETHLSTEDHYEIRLKGHLADRWTNWFEGLTITLEDNGDTLLTGPVVDQAALYGLLRNCRFAHF